ncbi:MAG: sensor histidine kinase [Proteobacteria bacterium]|nr:sensor histidine kinase [Pseudomonadota bacterium]
MFILVHRLFLLVLACLCWLAPPALAATPAAQQPVLVLSTDSYSPTFFKIFASMNGVLQQNLKDGYVLYPQGLDAHHLNNPAYRQQVHSLLQEKFRHTDFKAIVVIGNSALRFLLESQPRLWPDTPIVFTRVSSNALDKMSLPKNATGFKVGYSLSHTVNLARALLPQTKRLALIGNAPENDNYRPYFNADLSALHDQMAFIDLRGQPIEEIRQAAATLPQDTVIYFTSLTDDSTGRNFFSQVALQSIASKANRPILVDNETNIDAGVVGGIVYDPVTEGSDAGKLVQRVLQGEAASTIPIATSPAEPVFDWRELNRWHISRERLPPQSEVRHYEPTAWEQYRREIIAIIAVIVLQFGLMVWLLLEHKRRIRAEQDSRRRLAEIAHMNRITTATFFSATLAHELNQPLAAILSNTEAAMLFLKSDPPALKDVQEILNDIYRDDRRASDLILRMRELLKKSESTVQVIDLNDVVNNTMQFLAGEARNRNVMLTAHLSYHHLLVFADQVQLQQVIINLIINSMDALAEMPDGQRAISVRTALVDAGAEVCVLDSGPGFGDNLGRIFESFFTTKPHGMGLGLPIISDIVHSHGGHITAENSPGSGAMVCVVLPLHKESSI